MLILTVAAMANVATVEGDMLIERFRDVCIKGKNRLNSSEAGIAKIETIPTAIRNRYSDGTSSRFIELFAAEPTYLITVEYPQDGKHLVKKCVMVSQAFSLGRAWSRVMLPGGASQNVERQLDHEPKAILPKAEDGFILDGTREPDGFVTLTVSILNANQRRAVLKYGLLSAYDIVWPKR